MQRILCEGVGWDRNDVYNIEGSMVHIFESLMILIGSSPYLDTKRKYIEAFSMFNKETISMEEVFNIERAFTLTHII